MFAAIQTVSLDDTRAFESLAQSLQDWEPQLELILPPRDARLFEPDGTLYGLCLAETIRVSLNRREYVFSRGDLIVVPQGIALDLEPEVDLLGVRYAGTPPDHFRERFIQVWGFEHLPGSEGETREPSPVGFREIVATCDARHRIPYAICDLSDDSRAVGESRNDVVFLIALSGTVGVRLTESGDSVEIHPRTLAIVGPGQSYEVNGDGRAGRLILMPELLHEARRGPGSDPSVPQRPEYRPRSSPTS